MKTVKIVEMRREEIQYVQNLLPLNYKEKDNEIILGAMKIEENNELEACGALIAHMNGFSSEVIHIEVAQSFQREHIATQLLDYFIDLQFQIGEVWPITISYVDGADHQKFVSFIENRQDFDHQYDCIIYHIQPYEREASEICRKLRSLKKQGELFIELPQNTQNRFRQKIAAKGIPYLQNIDFKKLEPSLSYCVQKNNEIVAALLMQCESEQELEVVFAYADPACQMELAVASASAIKAIDKKYPEAVVAIVAAEEKSDIFVKGMFPNCMNKEAVFTAVWNYKGLESEDSYVPSTT